MPAAKPAWLVTVRSVDDNPRSGMQECALVSDREQLVLGDAGGWWSGGDGVWNIFCGKTLIQLKERDGLRWESGRGRAKIWL